MQNAMSALGQKQTCAAHKPMSALCQKRTSKEVRHESYGRLVPEEPITTLILAVAGALDYLPSRL